MVERDQAVCGYLRKLRVRVRGGGCGLRKSHLRNLGMDVLRMGKGLQGKARQESYSQGVARPIRSANGKQGRRKQGPTLQWSGDVAVCRYGTGVLACFSLVRRQKAAQYQAGTVLL